MTGTFGRCTGRSVKKIEDVSIGTSRSTLASTIVEQGKAAEEMARNAVNTAAENANNVAKAIQSKLDKGEFVGPQGPKGDTGESGIVAPASGMVTFAYDPTDGHLYAYSSENVAGSYQYDETDGHLYYVTEG